MMRLSCQSQKQQAQPEKGCPAARDGCVAAVRILTGEGAGRLSFSPNWLSPPSPFLGPCRGSPATNDAKGSESSLNTTMSPSPRTLQTQTPSYIHFH